jgi:ankyrin repeat protein
MLHVVIRDCAVEQAAIPNREEKVSLNVYCRKADPFSSEIVWMDACWEDAVRRGDIEIVRDLLARGVDPNARDRYGQTGVMLAAHGGQLAIARLLIEQGVDLNSTAKYGLSAVMLAVVAGHEEIALALARADADLTLRGTGAPGFAGKTAADLARERGLNHLATALAPAIEPS